jgi:hypothetical protein
MSEARPSIFDLMGPTVDAVTAGEMVLPELGDSPGLQGVSIEGALAPGLGVVSDPETGLRVILPSYQLFRGTAEYEEEITTLREVLRETAARSGNLTEAAQFTLEYGTHHFLHRAYDANEEGGDEALDAFIQENLLPQAGTTWALLDAYAQMSGHKLPEAGDSPSAITADILGDVDPYGDEGRELARALWILLESEMHPASVHPGTAFLAADVQAARDRKPVSKKAKKHAKRSKGR